MQIDITRLENADFDALHKTIINECCRLKRFGVIPQSLLVTKNQRNLILAGSLPHEYQIGKNARLDSFLGLYVTVE